MDEHYDEIVEECTDELYDLDELLGVKKPEMKLKAFSVTRYYGGGVDGEEC